VLDERGNEAFLMLQFHRVEHAPIRIDANQEVALGLIVGKVHSILREPQKGAKDAKKESTS
jgi:hypothetical protein